MRAYFLVCLVFLGSLGIKADFAQPPNAQSPPAAVPPEVQEEKVYTSLAEALKEPSKVKKLELSDVETIPPDIRNLENLTELTLLRLKKPVIPSAVFLLTTLESLTIGDSPLTTLPSEISQLRQLKTLCILGTELKALHPEIIKLVNLKCLNLHANKIRLLPEFIGSLSSLQQLYVSDNLLSALPKSLSKLTLLEELDLSGNQLIYLPAEITRLNQLKLLDVHHNKLRSLPFKMNQLKSLQTLHAGFNLYKKLPVDFHSFGNLKLAILDLWDVSESQFTKLYETSNPELILVYASEKYISGRTSGIGVPKPHSSPYPNNSHIFSKGVYLLFQVTGINLFLSASSHPLFRRFFSQTEKKILPIILRQKKPKYSERARKAKFQGIITLICTFEPDGSIDELELVKSIGLGLDEEAIFALLRVEFEPAIEKGVAVPHTSKVEFSYALLDESK